MRPWNRLVVAAIAAGVLAAWAPVMAWSADGDPESKTLPAQADTPARPAPLLDDTPRTRDTVLAAGGGLLVIVLAAVGLTITFRSLGADIRSRKHRYRRRIRREPRGT